MSERWRLVPDWPDYEVSDYGRVRSRKYGKKMLKLVRAKSGHLKIHLRNNERHRNEYVHRLVLLAFVGPCPQGKESRHYPDKRPSNNKLSNLSWATVTVNQRDRIEHNTHSHGVRSGKAKLTNAVVRTIRKIEAWPRGTLLKLAKKYGVSSTAILNVKTKRRWRHI
jgi:hypothetical protein